MSNDVRTEQEWIQVREADALRQQEQTTKAVERYDQVIAAAHGYGDAKLLAHAYAGRGAVKLALGFHSVLGPQEPAPETDVPPDIWAEDVSLTRGAIEDLILATHFDASSGWAWAQLGEAHRSFGRDHYRLMPLARFQQHVRKSLRAFEKARLLLPEQESWLLAHEAATHFLGLWRAYDSDSATLPDLSRPPAPGDEEDVWEAKKHLAQAERGFRDAIAANPNYAWAKRFLAYLLTIKGSYGEAQALLADALLDDPRAELHVIRSLSMLYRYAAQAPDLGPDERDRLLRLALRAGQQAMERDSEDFFAIYAHAAAGMDMGVPDAGAICREARARILNQAVRAIGMAFALHMHSGDAGHEFLPLLLDSLRNLHVDPEIVAIAHHDPVWTKPPVEGSGTLLQEIKKHLQQSLPKHQQQGFPVR
jgi:tetratricopeptide (TPR) repeat protein